MDQNDVYTQSVQNLPMLANFECEAAFLGGAMIDNNAANDVLTRLSPDDFAEPLHGKIWEKIQLLVSEGKAANPVTLKPFFLNDERMRDFARKDTGNPFISPVAYLGKLTGGEYASALMIGVRDFAYQIMDLARLRRIRQALLDAIEDVEDTSDSIDPEAVVARLDSKLAEDTSGVSKMAATSYAKSVDEVVEQLLRVEQGGELPGFEIAHFTDWNAVCGRMAGGDLTYLGARPSMGKTAVALAIAQGAARNGVPTDFYSLEQGRGPITTRALANRIYEPDLTSPYAKLTSGQLSAYDREAITAAREEIAKEPLYILDPDHMNVEELGPSIRRRRRALEKAGKLGRKQPMLVVIDYLGRFGTIAKIRDKTERVGYISRTIKSVAKANNVHIVCLVQLSRALEQRDDKHPRLPDLRDSGDLEQDGDNIAFLYRDEYYLHDAEPKDKGTKKWEEWKIDMEMSRNRLEIYSAKRREGALTKRTAYFYLEHMAIRSHDHKRHDLFA